VFAAAAKIRNGEMPEEGQSAHEEFAVRRFDSPDAVHAFIDEKVKADAIDFDEDLVLSPRNGEGEEPAAATVKSLNASIQAIENPHEDGVKFLADDRVMCTKNFPKLDIWNGTTGWITRVDRDGRPFFLPDDADTEYDEIRLGEKEQRDAITPAWCLTIHKAQGSQYRDVYVVCLRRDAARLFDRSMLYTAVTRAKRKCILLTDDGIDRIIGAVRRRRTYLQLLFKGEA
jgi:exodeoxyribonuclease V alpha subunit